MYLYVFVAVREGYDGDNHFLFLVVACFTYCDPDYEQGAIVSLM